MEVNHRTVQGAGDEALGRDEDGTITRGGTSGIIGEREKGGKEALLITMKPRNRTSWNFARSS